MSPPAVPATAVSPAGLRRWALTVRGVVQGVGFRPFIYNAARQENLTGWVTNEADAVRIEVEGPPEALERFLQTVRERHPPQARLDRLDVEEILVLGPRGPFEIRASGTAAAPRPTIPADLATCPECRREITTADERRHRYPFTNCTNCGPRWSIIEQLPYDRPRTSMRHFALCAACRAEYENPADRRFHAQPVACPRCGPQLTLLTADGQPVAERQAALDEAAAAVRGGRILAVKGLGGFQLILDATNAEAVARLRTRKRRPHKPLAVMLRDVDEVRRYCVVAPDEATALESPAAPILLLRARGEGSDVQNSELAGQRRPHHRGASPANSEFCTSEPMVPGRVGDATDIAPNVAPQNPYLGVMLPYTPLHHLLLALVARPIVCTSGNLSEEPMATETADALARLRPIADVVLTHDRPIVRPVDDSVARVGPGGLQILRRARGYAPLPIPLGIEGPPILATGGHLKNTVALRLGADVILGAHVGDLDNALSVAVHAQAIDDLLQFFAVRPEVVACDLHPDYASTQTAERLALRWDVPLVRVQHHHAHVAACMAEHRLDGPVLGLAWDGTGYGTDGTVWGGECLRCERGGFTRVAHLRTFPLPGGDRAAREPRRSALGVLFEMDGAAGCDAAREWFTEPELRTLTAALARPRLFPRTSSLGRLFDAVAAICGWPLRVSFEGQAAMALEFAAGPVGCDSVPTNAVGRDSVPTRGQEAYPLPLSDAQPAVADWEPLLRAVLADRRQGVPLGRIAARFHNALAAFAVGIASRIGCPDVALTGGCFQNAWLSERVHTRLVAAGFRVYTHRQTPPGDGGIALGQAWVAAHR